MARRPLTSGEIEMARTIFAESIDYSTVFIVRGKWWPLQPNGIVMAPTGNIHFHPADPNWSDDFSRERTGLQGLLMHELTHVWQTQTRGRLYLPLMRHPFCRYSYRIQEGRPFDRYGLEQQAEIVRHLFLKRRGAAVPNPAALAQLPLPFRSA